MEAQMATPIKNSQQPLIISVEEARKILGDEYSRLSDEDIIKLIDDLDFLARYAIKQFKELHQSV
jgi:hypothetical protein